MEYNKSAIPVILVEMPVSDGLYYFFGNAHQTTTGFSHESAN